MADQAKTSAPSTTDRIMRVGQELIQTQGYDGFSYRDIADRIGIKSASIHYHFPTKADLALAIAVGYRSSFGDAVASLDEEGLDPIERLTGFAAIFQNTLEKLNRVCLCGMLASEANSLPAEVRAEAANFFTDQQTWLESTILDGITSGQIDKGIQPDSFAQMFLSALEGSMIMALSMERPQYLAEVAAQLITLLRIDGPSTEA